MNENREDIGEQFLQALRLDNFVTAYYIAKDNKFTIPSVIEVRYEETSEYSSYKVKFGTLSYLIKGLEYHKKSGYSDSHGNRFNDEECNPINIENLILFLLRDRNMQINTKSYWIEEDGSVDETDDLKLINKKAKKDNFYKMIKEIIDYNQ